MAFVYNYCNSSPYTHTTLSGAQAWRYLFLQEAIRCDNDSDQDYNKHEEQQITAILRLSCVMLVALKHTVDQH